MVDGTVLAICKSIPNQTKPVSFFLTRQRNECGKESSRLVFYLNFFNTHSVEYVINHEEYKI